MEKSKITINKKAVEKEKRVEILGDIIVPDIKPDIVNIINTNANSYVYKKEINESKVRLDGNIDTFVIYLADNGETRSIQTTLNFSEIIEDSQIITTMKAKEKVNLIEVESKILNERKISIRAEVLLKVEMWENEEVEFLNNIDEELDIQKLEEKLLVKSCVGENTNRTSIKENVKSNSEVRIAEILKTSVELCNLENKISYNKVLAKADANIRIVFLSEENKIEKIDALVPVMSFIEIPGIADTNVCETEYNIRNMLYKIDTKDMNSIEVQIEYEVMCTAFENKEIRIIQDMYSTKRNITFNKKEARIKLAAEEESRNIRIEERVLVEDISSICDINCTPIITNKTVNGDNINYEGEVCLDILFEADNRNGLNFQKVKIPFVFKSEIEIQSTDLNIESKQFSVNNEYVSCNMTISIRNSSINMKKINIIDNIESQEINEENEYKMIVYFVKKGDTIWNIAKRFKVYSKNILKANNLEENCKINVGDRLYIMR